MNLFIEKDVPSPGALLSAILLVAVAIVSLAIGCSDGTAPLGDVTAPDSLQIEVLGATSLRVSWAPSSGATTNILERRESLQGRFESIQEFSIPDPTSPPARLSHVDRDLQPATFYGYRVRSVSALGGTSGPSTVAGGQTASPPGIVVTTSTSGPQAGLDPDGYQVRVTGTDTASSVMGPDDEFTFSPLAAGTYQVALEGISEQCSTEGENPRTVEVTDQGANTLSTLAFRVTCRDPNRGEMVVDLSLQGDTVPFTSLTVVASAPVDSEDVVLPRSLPVDGGSLNSTLRFTFGDLVPATYEIELIEIPTDICSFADGGGAVRSNPVAALDRDTVSIILDCTVGGGGAEDANVFGRWVNASGQPITDASVGETVRLQICTSVSFPASTGQGLGFQADIGWPTQLELSDSGDLDSSGSGVHPECVGTPDPLSEFWTLGTASPGEKRITVVQLTPADIQGKLGAADLTFEVTGQGRIAVSVRNVVIGQTGSPAVPVQVHVAPLCVDTTGCGGGGGGGGGTGAPTARPGGPYNGVVDQPLTFDGGGSSDPDGQALVEYRWDFGDGMVDTTASTTIQHTYDRVDTFNVGLTVVDAEGKTGSATTTARITQSAPSTPGNLLVRWTDRLGNPLGIAAVNDTVVAQICTTENLEAFQASISFPSNLSYVSAANLDSQADTGVHPECAGSADILENTFGATGGTAGPVLFSVTASGPAPESVTLVGVARVAFTVVGPGDVGITLSGLVAQRFGGQAVGFDPDVDTVRVPRGSRPVPEAGGPYGAAPGDTVLLDGSGSSDPDGDSLVTFTWDFGDGSLPDTLSGGSVRHVYDTVGVFRVRLTVEDATGLAAADSATVNIVEGGPDPISRWRNAWRSDTTTTMSGPVALDVYTNPGVTFNFVFGELAIDSLQMRYDSATAGPDFDALFADSLLADGHVTLFARSSDLLAVTVSERLVGTAWFTPLTEGTVPTSTSGVQVGPVTEDLSEIPVIEDTLLIEKGNEPPRADAGGPYTGKAGQGIAFSAANSFDPDGGIVDFSWAFGDGTTGTGPAPVHLYELSGSYTAILTVADNQGKTAEDTTSVTIEPNAPPRPEPNGPYSGIAGDTLTFNAAGSFDPDGSIASFTWDFGDGATESGVSPQHVYSQVGTFVVTLSASDQYGLEASTSTTATIEPPTHYALRHSWVNPGASLVPVERAPTLKDTPGSAGPGEVVGLKVATRPRDPDLRLVSYEVAWNEDVLRYDSIKAGAFFDQAFSALKLGAGRLAITAQSSDGPADPDEEIEVGTAYFTVVALEGAQTTTATSGLNLETGSGPLVLDALPVLESTLFVYELGDNIPPTAEANGPYQGTVGFPVQFDGAGTDPDGFIARYDWRFGDGTVVEDAGPRPAHTYTLAGQYTARLTVVDHVGSSATDQATVTILDAPIPEEPPTAEAGGPYAGTAGEPVTFDAGESSDPDGDIAFYVWEYGDGSAPDTTTSTTRTHVYGAADTYTATLTVVDEGGLRDTDQASVSITDSGGGGGGDSPPVANAGGSYTGTTGVVITLNASQSSDPDGDIAFYVWDYGDASAPDTTTSSTRTHVYNAADTYTATLTVVDAGGRSDTDQATVTITDEGGGGGNEPPEGPALLGRWVFQSGSQPAGTPADDVNFEVRTGDVLQFQICVTGVDPNAAEVKSSWDPGHLDAQSVALLQSTDANVHPHCVDTVDHLDEFFSASPLTQTQNHKVAVLDLTGPVGRPYNAGLAAYTFEVTASVGQQLVIGWGDPLVIRHDPDGEVPADSLATDPDVLTVVGAAGAVAPPQEGETTAAPDPARPLGEPRKPEAKSDRVVAEPHLSSATHRPKM